MPGVPGTGAGYPGGISLPGGIRLPGAIGLPGSGSTSPGIGYPGSRPAGGYPGSPGSRGEDPGGGIPGDRMQDPVLHIVQTMWDVQVTRNFRADGEDRSITQKFTLDDLENTNPASDGRGAFVSRSSWKNNRLVNSGVQTSRDENDRIDVREEYSLSKDGKILTIMTTKTSPRGQMNSRQVFNRE